LEGAANLIMGSRLPWIRRLWWSRGNWYFPVVT